MKKIIFFISLIILVSANLIIGQENEQNLYPIRQNGKFGYIDQTGTVVIEPQFDRAYYFSDNRARIQKGDKYGFINKEGKIIVDPVYSRARDSSLGVV